MRLLTISVLFLGIVVCVEDSQASAAVPVLDRNVWWGSGKPRAEDGSIKPFKIQVPDAVLVDLKDQLDRFLKRPVVSPLENVGFEYGFNADYLRTVVQFWKDEYDWRKREKILNSIPQYTTMVNGLKIHFLVASPPASSGKRVLPLLLLHGWPGSVKEFYGIIPILTRPNDKTDFVFEVIAPSIPGYGFSEGTTKQGMGPAEIAVIMDNLMRKLGFNKYYVQGGDWGSSITKIMAQIYPNRVLGAHSNNCQVTSRLSTVVTFVGSLYPPLVVEKKFQHLVYPLSKVSKHLDNELGYYHLQYTKPDTIGTALSTTPAGLAAYILEKFSVWVNPAYISLPDGGITKYFTLDDLLDNIMIYWVTNSITTSQRLYFETFNLQHKGLNLDEVPVNVPTACARFPNDLIWQPESILKLQYRNLIQVTDAEDGGHFAAFQLPRVLAADIFSAIDKIEKLRPKDCSAARTLQNLLKCLAELAVQGDKARRTR